jgi:transcriptional regulator with GAF, ATPase, and Fis domain
MQSLGGDSAEPGLKTLLPSLAQQFRNLGRIAAGDSAVLIRGETGSGKDLVAQAVHLRSPRRDRPFVAANCAAFQESLLLSELFGHDKGAFTGATADKIGLVRSAASGTLFLDEVGDLSQPAQAALLRTIQTKTVRPIGGTRDLPVDFRLVSATHRDLAGMVAKERFRADLYSRLNAFEIVMPPLRKRREDLGIIISHILQRHGRSIALSKEAATKLFMDDWPLNIRELEQRLVSACSLAGDGPIEPVHLGMCTPDEDESTDPSITAPEIVSRRPHKTVMPELSDQLIAQLKAAEGNVAAVARTFGKKPPQIFRWLKRFGIEPDEFRPKPRRGP